MLPGVLFIDLYGAGIGPDDRGRENRKKSPYNERMTERPPRRRPGGRAADALRPVRLQTGALKFAEGSVLIEIGDTRVLVAASVDNRVPPFMKDTGRGWLTAEYSMLPRATHTRSGREVNQGKPPAARPRSSA